MNNAVRDYGDISQVLVLFRFDAKRIVLLLVSALGALQRIWIRRET